MNLSDLQQSPQMGQMPQPPMQPQMGQSLQGLQQGGGQDPMIMLAQQLAQTPTMEIAQQMVMKMQESGSPNAEQFAQVVQQIGDNPEGLKQLADAILGQMQAQ